MCGLPFQSCPALRLHRLEPIRFLCPWDSPGKNTGVGCHFLVISIYYLSLSLIVNMLKGENTTVLSATVCTQTLDLINKYIFNEQMTINT